MYITEQQQDAIRAVITFLADNREFGDYWNEEIECLDAILESAILESCNKAVPNEKIKRAEHVLIDNGIEPDEAQIVLQAIGYALLDIELYEN